MGCNLPPFLPGSSLEHDGEEAFFGCLVGKGSMPSRMADVPDGQGGKSFYPRHGSAAIIGEVQGRDTDSSTTIDFMGALVGPPVAGFCFRNDVVAFKLLRILKGPHQAMGFHAAEVGIYKVFRYLTCRFGGATNLHEDRFYEAAGILGGNGIRSPFSSSLE